ncbi:hypothetical protein BUALT_Bualt12G0080100 [Buddleja alternifolia]|uniref:Uncharacterized protein n=1 Tax=Buddleja alternifolia TaxID=168488 RepID=A0AAV6WQV7_9LAMI|nr:hypothetical protein BUALT_Bualt12G0080100 [Buddleja alternifolia]
MEQSRFPRLGLYYKTWERGVGSIAIEWNRRTTLPNAVFLSFLLPCGLVFTDAPFFCPARSLIQSPVHNPSIVSSVPVEDILHSVSIFPPSDPLSKANIVSEKTIVNTKILLLTRLQTRKGQGGNGYKNPLVELSWDCPSDDKKIAWGTVLVHMRQNINSKIFSLLLEIPSLDCGLLWEILTWLSLNYKKKKGGKEFVGSSSCGFKGVLEKGGLIDLGSWSNKRGGLANIQLRFDRCVANADWIELFPKAFVSYLP